MYFDKIVGHARKWIGWQNELSNLKVYQLGPMLGLILSSHLAVATVLFS
jgi:hypothetical protein